MASKKPKFLSSPYFVGEPGKWHLKPGAPEEVVAEFEEFMARDEEADLEPVPKIKGE